MTVAFITEGVTDQILLRGILDCFLDKEYVVRNIQPPSSDIEDSNLTGPLGIEDSLSEGFKGVLQVIGMSTGIPDKIVDNHDLTIVQLDADCMNPLNIGDTSVPFTERVNLLYEFLKENWNGTRFGEVLLCIPSSCMETWVLAFLHPEVARTLQNIENRTDIYSHLYQRPPHRLIRMKGDRFRRVTKNYRDAATEFGESWCNVEHSEFICLQAISFDVALRASSSVLSP